MKQVSQSSCGKRMWQVGNGQDKEGIYEVLVNLNNSLHERPRESPNQPPVSASHTRHILALSLSITATVHSQSQRQADYRMISTFWQHHLVHISLNLFNLPLTENFSKSTIINHLKNDVRISLVMSLTRIELCLSVAESGLTAID